MLFWISTLILLVVASLCVLLPLAGKQQVNEDDVPSSLDFFKEQIRQLDSEIEQQKKPSLALLSERAEVARRMLKEARRGKRETKNRTSKRGQVATVSICAVLGVPALTLALYATLGAGGQADYPLSARKNLSLAEQPVEDLVQRAETHLATNPDDTKGWTLLADVYGRLNKPLDRARALRQLVRIEGETPELLSDLGEALTIIGGNIVPAEARTMFEKALAEKPSLIKPNIYIALALDQEGKPESALKIWEGLATLNQSDPRWAKLASDQIQKLREKTGLQEPAQPGIDEINAMVASLADRLSEQDGTVREWSRLMRSYIVLDEPVKASLALDSARKQFVSEPENLQKINQLAKQLGVAEVVRSEGIKQ